MEKERLKTYKTVIDNNEKILKIYEYLCYLSVNNKTNNQAFKNLKHLIAGIEEKNEDLLRQYDLYDQELINYINLLIARDDEPVSKTMDLLALKNNMFIEQLEYLRNTTKFVYDKDKLYENILVEVDELGHSLHREDAIIEYKKEVGCSLEEATIHIDELYENEKNLFFINEDDSILKRKMALEDEKDFNYLRDTYTNAVYVNYLFKNIKDVDNLEVRQYVYTLIYTLIAKYPAVGKIFLNKNKFNISNLPEKKWLLNLYNIVDFREKFFDGWDDSRMQMIEDIADTLTALECKGRLSNFDTALNIELKSKMQTCESLIFDKDNLEEVREQNKYCFDFFHRKSTKKLIRESNHITKNISLSEK